MAPYAIRKYGDPVLRQRAAEVTEIDGKLAKLADDMLVTMYDAPGVGLAAPQVGVQKRLFVYDVGREGPSTHHQPRDRRDRRRVGLRRGLPVDPRPVVRAGPAQPRPPRRSTTSTATSCPSRPSSSRAAASSTSSTTSTASSTRAARRGPGARQAKRGDPRDDLLGFEAERRPAPKPGGLCLR